jgi:hypothetical protein
MRSRITRVAITLTVVSIVVLGYPASGRPLALNYLGIWTALVSMASLDWQRSRARAVLAS